MNRSKMSRLLEIGVALFAIYRLWEHFNGEIPDQVAYPVMIISIICMLVGLFFSSRDLTLMIKNSKEK